MGDLGPALEQAPPVFHTGRGRRVEVSEESIANAHLLLLGEEPAATEQGGFSPSSGQAPVGRGQAGGVPDETIGGGEGMTVDNADPAGAPAGPAEAVPMFRTGRGRGRERRLSVPITRGARRD
jgi:hypothetical protein